MRNKLIGLPACAVLFVLVTACSTSEPAATQLGTATAPITGGEDDTGADAHEAVVLLTHGLKTCSGTLIAPNVVLTAHHCVAEHTGIGPACDIYGNSLNGDQLLGDLEPSAIEIRTGANATNSPEPVARGMQIVAPASKSECNEDIALVILDQPITNVTPQKIRLTTPPIIGEPGTAVGYGETSEDKKDYGIRHRASASVVTVGMDWNASQGEQELSVSQAVCAGDSGGPMLSAGNAVIGLASGKYVSCDEPNAPVKYMRVDTHKALIDQALAAAGATVSVEIGTGSNPTPKAIGEGPCTSGAECTSYLCQAGENSFCTDFCGTCPDGMSCILGKVSLAVHIVPTNICVAIPNDTPCEACRATGCPTLTGGCYGSAECNALLTCVDGCTDPSCVQGCADLHPDGAEEYAELTDCVCTTCADECSQQCLPPPGSGGAAGAAGGGGVAGAAGSAGSSTAPPVAADDSDDGGCGCSTPRTSESPSWLFALAALAFARRRRG